MKDATRAEVIQWCKEKNCDFINPVFPPPSGWAWAGDGDGGLLVLTSIFTDSENTEDITKSEVEHAVTD